MRRHRLLLRVLISRRFGCQGGEDGAALDVGMLADCGAWDQPRSKAQVQLVLFSSQTSMRWEVEDRGRQETWAIADAPQH